MQRRRISQPLQDQIKLAAMVAIAAAPLFVLASVVPRPLVLPVVCLIAIVGAAGAAWTAWRFGVVRNAQHITAWDVSGALAFIACAAAVMSDPNQVAALTTTATTVADLSSARLLHP